VSPYIGVQDSEGLKDKSIPVGNVIWRTPPEGMLVCNVTSKV
jgi:hypothetical protein